MGKTRKTRTMNISVPLLIWLLAGAFSVSVVAVAVMLYTPVVQADALLPRPIATAPPGPPILVPTPASLAPKINPASSKKADILHGVASWYGGVFNGRHTASGETFDMYAMTACHPTLPFGTVVRVTNRQNNRSVVVRITDRGYLYKGRMLDLSYGAAEKLAMLKSGTAKVDLEIISMGEDSRHRRRNR
jgi:rare lipoprotein A